MPSLESSEVVQNQGQCGRRSGDREMGAGRGGSIAMRDLLQCRDTINTDMEGFEIGVMPTHLPQ